MVESFLDSNKKKREVKLNMKSVDSRIDLRGMDSEEACYRTDKYLDELNKNTQTGICINELCK